MEISLLFTNFLSSSNIIVHNKIINKLNGIRWPEELRDIKIEIKINIKINIKIRIKLGLKLGL